MAKRRPAKDVERLNALIEEATVDCYDEEEQLQGLVSMMEENVVFPFRTKVIGEEVEVTDFTDTKAVCQHKGKEYQIDITSLEWVKPYPEGFEWIEAYLEWRRRGV
jgi:hypothetical protein